MLSVAISIVTPSFPRAPAFYVRWSNDHCSRLAGSDVQITRHGRKHTHEPTARKPGAPPKHFDHGSHLELSEYQLARRMQDVKLCLQPPVPPNGQGRGKHPLPPGLNLSTPCPPKGQGRGKPPFPVEPPVPPNGQGRGKDLFTRSRVFNPTSSQMARAEANPPPPRPSRADPPPEIWSSTADAERGAYAKRWYVDSGVCKINARYVSSIITSASPPSPRSSKLKRKLRSRLT